MRKGTLVGYYNMGNGAAPVVCLRDTGDLVIMDHLCGPTYISEITIEDPMEYVGDEDICASMDVDGVVICESGMYTFKDGKYYFAHIYDLQHPEYVSCYDTEQEYDGDDISYDE